MTDDRVLVNEMCALLGCSKEALSHMTRTGDLARPVIVSVPGRRVSHGGSRQRAWVRSYVEALLLDPTPAVARSIARARSTGSAEDHVGYGELARMLGCSVTAVHGLGARGQIDRPVPIPGGRTVGWPRERVERLLADPPEGWLRLQTLRLASLRAGGLVEAADVARALGVPVDRKSVV